MIGNMSKRIAPWQGLYDHQDWRAITRRDLAVAIISGLFVFGVQVFVDNGRDAAADRRENLRFVREQVANGKAGEVSFRGIDLAGQNLGGLDLSGADLADANLSGADLYGTDFSDAELMGADLTGARMYITKFVDAHLDYADLSGTAFERVDFTGAGLFFTFLSDTTWKESSFSQADIVGVDFSRAKFNDIDLSHNHIEDAKFYGADLAKARLPPPNDGNAFGSLKELCFDTSTIWPQDFPANTLKEMPCKEEPIPLGPWRPSL